MDIESVRKFCLSLPHVDEKVQWENDLLFRIGGKMFAVVALEPSHGVLMSFKCTPEKFAELVERDGIIPAPYVARYHWVGFERFDAVPDRELKELLTNAYDLVRDKLPKKIKDSLGESATQGDKGNRPRSNIKTIHEITRNLTNIVFVLFRAISWIALDVITRLFPKPQT